MTDSSQTVRLSAEEADYLSKLTSEDDSLASLLRSHPDILVKGRIVTLNRSTAEMLRDYFMDRVVRVGFDADYKPNIEGQLLERLIDTFFIPEG